MKKRRQLTVDSCSDSGEKFQYSLARCAFKKLHRRPGDSTEELIVNAFAGTLARFEERKGSMEIEIK
jgi:hypothetical protein